MSESRLPLYAYVDETGNTGHNIFDEVQPEFFTAAFITKGDFDLVFADAFSKLLAKHALYALHGKELGVGGIERISPDLLKMLRASKGSFFVSRVQKSYLLAAKLFDTIFDSGENAAVAWHSYNLRATRIILTFKLSSTLTTLGAKMFWDCILEKKENKINQMLIATCKILLEDLDVLKDVRAHEILSEGLRWAIKHPETLQVHTDRKIARQGHFPNMVAFANLLDGLDMMAKQRNKRVARITHDQQSEFAQTLRIWHDMFSHASAEELSWAGETYSFQKVVGSEFDVKADSLCPGVQIADIVLWLYKQHHSKKQLPPGCAMLVNFLLATGWENDFSFAGVEAALIKKYGHIMFGPLSADKEELARTSLQKLEAARRASMLRYERDAVPPFLRKPTIDQISN